MVIEGEKKTSASESPSEILMQVSTVKKEYGKGVNVNIEQISIMKLSFYYLKKKFLISQKEKQTKNKKEKRKRQRSDRAGTKQLEKE